MSYLHDDLIFEHYFSDQEGRVLVAQILTSTSEDFTVLFWDYTGIYSETYEFPPSVMKPADYIKNGSPVLTAPAFFNEDYLLLHKIIPEPFPGFRALVPKNAPRDIHTVMEWKETTEKLRAVVESLYWQEVELKRRKPPRPLSKPAPRFVVIPKKFDGLPAEAALAALTEIAVKAPELMPLILIDTCHLWLIPEMAKGVPIVPERLRELGFMPVTPPAEVFDTSKTIASDRKYWHAPWALKIYLK